MKPLQRIKARVTSDKWPNNGKDELITIPKFLERDFVKYGYGEIVKESPEEPVIQEKKKRKPRTK